MLSCSTVAYDGYDVTLAIERVAGLGFDGVELGFIEGYVGNFSEALFAAESVRIVRGALNSTGLACTAVAGHIDLSDADAIERVSVRLQFASELGAPRLITNGGIQSNSDAFYANLSAILRKAERYGVIVCLENPGNGVPNVVNDGATAATVMRHFQHPYLRVNYDFGNTASHFNRTRSGHFPAESDFVQTLPWLDQLHLKDVRRTAGGEFEYPALGEGEIDFSAVFGRLAVAECKPLLCLEIPTRLRRDSDGTPRRLPEPVAIPEIGGILRRSREYVLSVTSA